MATAVSRARDAIRGGTYFPDETLVFDASDSGTHECPVTYTVYAGKYPVISGGFRIAGDWKRHEAVGDAKVVVIHS